MASFVTHAERRVHFLSKLALPNVIILNAVKERELGLGTIRVTHKIISAPEHETAEGIMQDRLSRNKIFRNLLTPAQTQ